MFQNNLLMAAASISAGGITVDDSVRYNDDDSPRLYRTPSSAGNQLAGSISLWYKRCNLGSIQQLFNSGAGDDITFNASDQLTFTDSSGVSYITTQVFRDPSAWGHLLFAWDTTLAAAGDRLRIYHNGTEITAFDTETNPSQNDRFEISNTVRQTVGANESDTEEFDGYLSQVYLVDGQQLTPASFGETDDNGVWRPKAFSSPSAVGSTPTIAFVDSATSSSTATTYTFSSMGIGTASSGREILVGVSGAGADVTLNSVTVGGVAGTFVAHQDDAAVSVSLYRAAVSTGTTADVVVVFSSNKTSCGAATYECTDLPTFPYDVIGATTLGSTANRTLTVNVPADGTVMGFVVWDANPVATTTWTGITETFDDQVKVNNSQFSGAMDTFDTAQAVTMTMDPSGTNNQNSRQLAVSWGTKAAGYGTNGFFLDFADSSDFGNDVSGNNNDYTSSGLAADDQVSDTPTDNKCTLSPIDTGTTTLSDGNTVATYSSTFYNTRATFGVPSSGKWSFQIQKSASNMMVGLVASGEPYTDVDVNGRDALYYYDSGGTSAGSIGTRRSGSDVVEVTNDPPGIAVDTNMEILIDKDNDQMGVVISGTAYMAVDSGVEIQDTMDKIFVQGANTSLTVDFGQGGYSPSQSGYKALATANLPTPTILDGTANFQTTLYTGDGSTRNIDQTENSTFQPDMVWIKNRSTTDPHMLIDATRGVTKELNPDTYTLETTDANGLTSFDADGFGLGTGAGGYNDNTESFVAWQWLAGGGAGSSNEDGTINTTTTTVNTTAGISVGTYTGTGSAATIGHGLGVAPVFVMCKERSGSGQWFVYHVGNTTVAAAENTYLVFNENQGSVDNATIWNDTAPTSTVFSIGTNSDINGSTNLYVSYAFADVEGFSKFSHYIGNGLADGACVHTGFKPAFIIIKKTTSANWVIYDSTRSPYNEIDDQLIVNLTTAETTGSEELDFLSNGFKIRTTDADVNTSGSTYVYMAFAEYPFGGEDVTPSTTF